MAYTENTDNINLNRPLPDLPLELCLDLPPNLILKPAKNSQAISNACCNQTDLCHRGCTKRGSENRAYQLSLIPKFQPPNCEASASLEPIKCSCQEATNYYRMSSSSSYDSIIGFNPFIDQDNIQKMAEEYVENRDSLVAESDVNGQDNLTTGWHQKPQWMSQSHSENSFKYRQPLHSYDHAESLVPRLQNINPTRDEHSTLPNLSLYGDTSRMSSPLKPDDIYEDGLFSSASKRSRSQVKQLFGEHGWLGRTTSMKELPSDEYRKKGFRHWVKKSKQRVEEITDDVSKRIPSPLIHHGSPSKAPPTSKFPVSLDPPTQSKIYSEIELMICATANRYLLDESQSGRMDVESLRKITHYWQSKNRPQVIEFQFDQATQRDLVLLNLKTFRFYGPSAENPVALTAMLQSWKTLAKEMSVRTFCTPDSVIKKQMHDCYKILEMLGAPFVTFFAFQDVQLRALKLIVQQQKRLEQCGHLEFGVERKWEPKEGGGQPRDNPFA